MSHSNNINELQQRATVALYVSDFGGQLTELKNVAL
jgi:hypothetical protein